MDDIKSLFFVNQDNIKNLDFVSARMQFFKECLRNIEKFNNTVIQCFEKTGVTHYNIPETQDLVDFYLKAVREMKKRGRDRNDLIIWPPSFAYALNKKVLKNLENKQKYRKALQSL